MNQFKSTRLNEVSTTRTIKYNIFYKGRKIGERNHLYTFDNQSLGRNYIYKNFLYKINRIKKIDGEYNLYLS
jgi:hypothetical protein